ncbi:MAG: RNA polymerase sigma factor SigM [Acidobacteria bacterium]|nr:MAG: RNA polymerase sigma factor SigM [Acidobacteriota bacterium]
MSDDRDDKELVQAYIDGRDPDDFAEITTRHADRVFSLCLRMTGNRQDALDASQEVFLRLLRKIHLYDGSAAFTTWLHRVASNVCYDQLRSRSRRPMPVEDPPEMADLTPLRDMDSAELRPVIEEALALLPYDYRAPIVLRDMEGYSYEQIEDALEIPGGTVRSRLHRGRRILADHLRNLIDDDDRQSSEDTDATAPAVTRKASGKQ